MQRFHFILICAVLCVVNAQAQSVVQTRYYKNNPELGGDGTIKQATMTAENNITSITFDIDVPQSGKYNLAFWVCPTQLPDGTFASYNVLVNQVNCGKLAFGTGDWQNVAMQGNPQVLFNKGLNKIVIQGNAPDVPNVEHVRLANSLSKATISNNNYQQYKSELIEIVSKVANSNGYRQITIDTTNENSQNRMSVGEFTVYEDPLYDYSFELNLPINYTFFKLVSFTAGQKIFLATNGIDNFSHVLEFFSSTNPSQYSWSALSNDNCMASLNITVPVTGMYYVRVRSYRNGQSGLCNLNVNGENYYSNIPIFSRGMRCTQPTDAVYNTFTCMSTGDPFIWIEEGSSIPGKIYTFNDDYSSTGDFDWGRNARIKMKYTKPVHSVLLSTYSSYSPTAKCDLYAKCKTANIVLSYFPLLQSDDAIQSSHATQQYNCISWSGGITSYWEWPPSKSSTFHNSDTLQAFDNFYASKLLTRSGADTDNGIVALWAHGGTSGHREYTHASIRKGTINKAHGYDWESKAGSLMRFFHPRDAVGGSSSAGYGQIVEYYRKQKNTSLLSMEEDIADKNIVIEYVDFTPNELTVICSKINSIRASEKQEFETAYANWRNIFNTTIHSNPDLIKDCDEYRTLLSLCNSNSDLLYSVYQKLASNENASMILVEDLIYDKYPSIVQDVQQMAIQKFQDSEPPVYRPMLTNSKEIVQRVLTPVVGQTLDTKETMSTDYSYSNEIDLELYSSPDAIEVQFTLPNSASNVSLELVDRMGYIIDTAIINQTLDSGVHTFCLKPDKDNIYLVRLTVDGKVNVKKTSFNQ